MTRSSMEVAMCMRQCSSWKTAREKTSLPGASGKCIGGGRVYEL